jgi:hypothetical protein
VQGSSRCNRNRSPSGCRFGNWMTLVCRIGSTLKGIARFEPLDAATGEPVRGYAVAMEPLPLSLWLYCQARKLHKL